jgi:(p)ppGpp synthase/HD superfamily hydrolase
MAGDSRVAHFEHDLHTRGFHKALEALDWLKAEMSAEKGFKRHNGAHYYYHPIDCAQDILNHGIIEEPIITAVLLHDMPEDVPGITIQMVEHGFGERVAATVDLMTKKVGLDYKNPEVLAAYLEGCLSNRDSAVGKTSDRKNNFSTLIDASFEKQWEQAIETRDFYIPFFKACRKKYAAYSHYFFSAKTAVEPILWHILKHQQDVAELRAQIAELNANISFLKSGR